MYWSLFRASDFRDADSPSCYLWSWLFHWQLSDLQQAFEGGSAPKHVQQFLQEGHLRCWLATTKDWGNCQLCSLIWGVRCFRCCSVCVFKFFKIPPQLSQNWLFLELYPPQHLFFSLRQGMSLKFGMFCVVLEGVPWRLEGVKSAFFGSLPWGSSLSGLLEGEDRNLEILGVLAGDHKR